MAKRAPSLSSRLSRRSRRALAAFLLLGGSAITVITVITATASAHDHEPDRIDTSEAIANSPFPQAADLVGSADDWLSEDCWDYDCCVGTCAEAISPTKPIATPGNATPGKADRKAEKLRVSRAAIGKPQDGKGDAVEKVVNSLRIQDWVAWGSGAGRWISPLLAANDVTPLASEPKFDRDLSDLTCEEPVDVAAGMRSQRRRDMPAGQVAKAGLARPDALPAAAEVASETVLATETTAQLAESQATEPPKFGPAGLVGGSAVIATLSESYLPYDLSPEDAIAMRMYPIGYPQSSYLGARRTGAYAPIDALAGGLQWRERTEPAITLRTEEVAHAAPPSAKQSEADQRLAHLANMAIAAVQPDSHARASLHPRQVAAGLGQWVRRGNQTADAVVGGAAARLAAVWKPAPRPRGEKLVAEAAPPISPSVFLEAASPILPTDQGRLLRVELACQTAIDVVLAQAARSARTDHTSIDALAAATIEATATNEIELTPATAGSNNDPPHHNEIARAEAVATACDQTAASLEKLAMALRRAGDSLVRQAKAGAESGTLLR